jgi:hypothetical protein
MDIKKEKVNFKDPEQKKQYYKEYYNKNKKTILNSMLQKVKCPLCLSEVGASSLQNHQATKKCKNRMMNLYANVDLLKNTIKDKNIKIMNDDGSIRSILEIINDM